MNKKILHITSSYPGKDYPYAGIFIKRHIQSLELFCENYILVANIVNTARWPGFEFKKAGRRCYILNTQSGILPWSAVTLLHTFFQLISIFFIQEKFKFDAINYHIAYPNLISKKLILTFIKSKIIITEHSSSFKYGFNQLVKKDKAKIQNIFSSSIPLVVVSNSLGKDIQTFTGCKTAFRRIFNTVNTETFFNLSSSKRINKRFISIAGWSKIKRPFLLLEEFKKAIDMDSTIELLIGGNGILIPEMKTYVKLNKLEGNIKFLGILSPDQVNQHLNQSVALVCTSEYETFSVICAESLCSGTPIIIPELDSIQEYAKKWNSSNFGNKCGSSLAAIVLTFDHSKFNNNKISHYFQELFSLQNIGKQYYDYIIEQIG